MADIDNKLASLADRMKEKAGAVAFSASSAASKVAQAAADAKDSVSGSISDAKAASEARANASRTVRRTPLDARVSEMSDAELEAILQLRKKIKGADERRALVCGLYYIASVDDDYAASERLVVEGTACALGIDGAAMSAIAESAISPAFEFSEFASVGKKKFKESLFEEMGMLTYAKGYQLQIEDDAMCSVAKAMEISEDKTEEILESVYMKSQGFEDGGALSSNVAKVALGLGAVAVGASLCAVTAGAAAPAIGASLGSGMGLGGAAAVNAGLAILGGGAVAAGGAGVAGGTALITAAGAIIGGGGTALAVSVKENISSSSDKRKLKDAVKRQQKERKTKQEIIGSLIDAIALLEERVATLEKANASKRDIEATRAQIANLEAQKAEIELENV